MAEKTIHFVSLGCAKNRVDTEIMLGVSGDVGFRHVDDPSDAEVIVVNTCGFIQSAKEESIETIFEMAQHKEGLCHKLVVSGCLSQRYADDLANDMPEVDVFLGSSDMLKLGDVLRGSTPRLWVGHPAEHTITATDPRTLTQRGHSAYVKIAEGCNRSCSFCAIPGIRGTQRSRTVEDIVMETTQLVSLGVKEFNLVSQDTISFGRDLDTRATLAELVEAISDVPGVEWLRLHYLYPERLTKELIAAIRERDNVLPYIDMPLQHAATNMLKRMRRGHGGERLYKVVDRLRDALPDMVFRTTFIAGHPGETDADFQELCDFVSWAKFDHVGVFTYSHEEGTRSGDMDDLVSDEVIVERRDALVSLQRPISRAKLDARVGEELTVLVDGLSDESDLLLEGRYWGQAPDVDGKVYLANGSARPGELRRALVREASDYDLVADFVGEDGRVDLPPDVAPVSRKRTLKIV